MNKAKKILYFVILSLLIGGTFLPSVLSFVPEANAAATVGIPSLLSYQGRLKNSSGTALTGSYDFTFKLYDESTGGSLLWTEAETLTVTGGYFSTTLGDGTAFSTNVDFTKNLWLEILVGPNGGSQETMSSRLAINSVAFALASRGIENSASDPATTYGGRMYYNTGSGNVYVYDAVTPGWSNVYRSGGTDVAVADGGTGASNASVARTNLGLAINSDVQAYDADLTTYAGITPSANIQTLLGSADYAVARTNLSLVVGTNVQAYDADLTTYAGITPSTDIQTLLGSANNTAAQTNLGVLIGTNVQAYDADLTTYAGITPSSTVQTFLGSANTSAAQTNLDLLVGTNVQAYDADLTTYAGITPSANIQTLLASADFAAARTNLELGTIATQNSNNVTITGGSVSGLTSLSTTGAITVAPTTTGTLLDYQLETEWTTGTIVNADFGSPTTLTNWMTGMELNFGQNLNATNQNVTGVQLTMPSVTNTEAGTYNHIAFSAGPGAPGSVIQQTLAGTTTWIGYNANVPAITQTTGTVNAYGVKVTGGAVTSGNAYGVYVDMNSTANDAIYVNQGKSTFNGGVIMSNATISGGSVSGITDLAVADGGTGASSWTQYGLLYAPTTGTLGQITDTTAGKILITNSGAAPSFSSSPSLTMAATDAFAIDASTTAHTGTSGAIDLGVASSTNNVVGIDIDTTSNSNSTTGLSGVKSTIRGYSGGQIESTVLSAFTASVVMDDNDSLRAPDPGEYLQPPTYYAFDAGDVELMLSGTRNYYGLHVGKNWGTGIAIESGSAITFVSNGSVQQFFIQAATQAAGSYSGPSISIQAGSGMDNGTGAQPGGAASLAGGQGTAGGTGGGVNLTGGSGSGGGVEGTGGSVTLTGGTAGDTTAAAGNVVLIGADAFGGGAHGYVKTGTGGTVNFTPGATQGDLYVQGQMEADGLSSAGGSDYYLCINDTNGTIGKSSGVCGGSSLRYKENIANLTQGMSLINQMRPVAFDWKTNGKKGVGLIAEEVEKIAPELVGYDDQGRANSLHYDWITAYLIKALQEQDAKIQSLGIGNSLQGNLTGNIVIDNLTVNGRVAFGNDSVGQAKILPGATAVIVKFDQEYEYQPIVTVTPRGDNALVKDFRYAVVDESAGGFTIKISVAQDQALEFNWHAFGAKQGQLIVSDGQKQNIEIIVSPYSLVQPAANVAVDLPAEINNDSVDNDTLPVSDGNDTVGQDAVEVPATTVVQEPPLVEEPAVVEAPSVESVPAAVEVPSVEPAPAVVEAPSVEPAPVVEQSASDNAVLSP